MKWGGNSINDRVNGEGHSVLQYLNGIDYIQANPEEFKQKPESGKETK